MGRGGPAGRVRRGYFVEGLGGSQFASPGAVDRLREMGYRDNVSGIWFSERALEPEKYLNKRSEIIMAAAKWINDRNVSIPDEDT